MSTNTFCHQDYKLIYAYMGVSPTEFSGAEEKHMSLQVDLLPKKAFIAFV